MKERYCYNLGNGEKEYTVDEIANKLFLDKEFLESILNFDEAEINSAIMKATKEKVLSEKMDFLKQNFSCTYLFEKGSKYILTNYFELNKRKKALLDSVESVLDMESDGYFTFSSDTLDLISVNTVINYDKTPYTLKQIKSLESLKSISNGAYSKFDLDNCFDILGEELSEDELSLTISTGNLTLNLNHSRNLIDFVTEHSLPIIYNEMMFENSIGEEKIGKRCVTYIKK